MSVKPILFNTAMVKAILDGRKTVTRRIIKPQPTLNNGFWKLDGAGWGDNIKSFHPIPCHSLYNRMPYQPGDILYVREAWQKAYEIDDFDQIIEGTGRYLYAAGPEDVLPHFTHWLDPNTGEYKEQMPWKPSIHMPKEAARIWLKVTDVQVERLQEITVQGIQKEGLLEGGYISQYATLMGDLFSEFKTLWDSTIKKSDLDRYGWDANPWVWVIEFERCEKPESEGTN